MKQSGKIGVQETELITIAKIRKRSKIIMRSFLLLIALSGQILTAETSVAQWTTSGSNIYYSTGRVGLGTASPGTVLHLKTSDPTQVTLERINSTANVNILYKNSNNAMYAGLDANGGFTIGTAANLLGSLILTATANGSVGIGTANPQGYRLAVAGNMIAESVKVKLQGSWPDYVFAKDYPLLTLAEIEKHIKEHGHLPGIPSAAEVKKDGVELGDMNKKLLQKIEELTLYLIKLNKTVEDQSSELVRQREQINRLKNLN